MPLPPCSTNSNFASLGNHVFRTYFIQHAEFDGTVAKVRTTGELIEVPCSKDQFLSFVEEIKAWHYFHGLSR